MRTPAIRFMASLLLFAAAAAHAQLLPPEPPQVTLGADLKFLRFDWDPEQNATFYRLWVKSGGASSYKAVGERIPAHITQVVLPIPVHLQDWSRTRYVVTACNNQGCRSSAALNPGPLMLDAIGYLKASNTERADAFGTWVALSDDGYTLAVSAPNEDSSASGINGDQSDNASTQSGAVYVYRRRGNSWQQEAYLKAGINRPFLLFGASARRSSNLSGMALSADGSMLAVSATEQDLRGIEFVGAVYVFRRTGFAWSLMATLRSPEPRFNDFFGSALDISDDGRTLKVMSDVSTGEPGRVGRTHFFVLGDNSWEHTVSLAPFYSGDICFSTRMSGDGQTLVSSCIRGSTVFRIVTMKRMGEAWVHAGDLRTDFFELFQPIGLNTDATVMALSDSGATPAVHVYRWNGGEWIADVEIPAQGGDLEFDASGRLLAIGSDGALEDGAGVSPMPMPGAESRGAVYLFQRNNAGIWTLRNVVKSPNPGVRDGFGGSLSLSGSGRTLVVGTVGEDSNAKGIDGDRTNEGAEDSGAAYLY